ncbi:IclR family transcriptional regulator [Metasolibacillus fluoroglycofenilyticus]|uniref:IclR family transcriptional regulator n=1 Tax=Metasolibacillus fluoroglycofenilyticus TaxID=1239396 RepID=UPI000D3CF00E|nr:IclR family transcriptional regulator [Metasolibacillus fluoroglycofenilyticus]
MNTNTLSTNKNSRDGSTVQAVDRALMLLKLIGESKSPISLKDLVASCGLNRTTVWRLIGSLENEGLVEKDPMTNGYRLGFLFYRLAMQNNPYNSLIHRAKNTLEALRDAIDETVILSVPKMDGIYTINQLDPSQSVRLVDYTNTITPLHHCTSNGKVLLSTFSENELEQYLSKELIAKTTHTITDKAQLIEQINWTRHNKVGLSIGEYGENENAMSAPIFDTHQNLVAFITIGGPGFRLTKEDLLNLKGTLLQAAKEIEQNLTSFGK